MSTDRDVASNEPPRAWQRMLSGRRLDLLHPSPNDIAIEDIAHGLARVARWNGQTLGAHAYSVAQHALLVEDIVHTHAGQRSRQWLLAALLHDAPEYVIGDLISPFKAAIGLDYKAFEARLLEAIHIRFGLPARLPDEVSAQIKAADRMAAYFEATLIAGFVASEAERFFGDAESATGGNAAHIKRTIEPLSATAVQDAFLARFRRLADTSEL